MRRGDCARALAIWRPLAATGNSITQTNLGGMYYQGQGAPQDYLGAFKWYRLAAAQGNADAQYALGAA